MGSYNGDYSERYYGMEIVSGTIGAIKGTASLVALFINTLVPPVQTPFIDLPPKIPTECVQKVKEDAKRRCQFHWTLVRAVKPKYQYDVGCRSAESIDVNTYIEAMHCVDELQAVQAQTKCSCGSKRSSYRFISS